METHPALYATAIISWPLLCWALLRIRDLESTVASFDERCRQFSEVMNADVARLAKRIEDRE